MLLQHNGHTFEEVDKIYKKHRGVIQTEVRNSTLIFWNYVVEILISERQTLEEISRNKRTYSKSGEYYYNVIVTQLIM